MSYKSATRSLSTKLRNIRAFVWRRRLNKTTVIGITGSCGKTSTVYFLHHILAQQGVCHLGINHNIPRVVIKNILKVKRSDRFYIQEISGHEPGVINRIVRHFSPDISVVTTIGQDHYTNYRTLEAVAEEKGTLVEHTRNGGMAVLNLDDNYVAAMAERTSAHILTFGINKNADVRASNISATWPERLSLTVNYRGSNIRIDTGLVGSLWVTSVLAAVAAALAAGISLADCASALHNIDPVNRRMSLHQIPAGAMVISDCNKAPYWGLYNCINVLSDAKAPRKTLVVGSISDMSGSVGSKYRNIAREGLAIADRVIFVGVYVVSVRKMITPENASRLFAFDSIQEAARFLEADVMPEEVILIKSGKKEHLERLYHSQSLAWSCWKYPCMFPDDCLECKDNGLNESEDVVSVK